VQIQLYGINMTGCWENPSVCPTWTASYT
jgi:hypothetical protein